jgi:hypothetical protein
VQSALIAAAAVTPEAADCMTPAVTSVTLPATQTPGTASPVGVGLDLVADAQRVLDNGDAEFVQDGVPGLELRPDDEDTAGDDAP